MMKRRKIKRNFTLLLTQILLVSSSYAGPNSAKSLSSYEVNVDVTQVGADQTSSAGQVSEQERLAELQAETEKLRKKNPNRNVWLRGPQLEKIFQKVNGQLNLFLFLTPHQKKLLRENEESEIKKEANEHLKKKNIQGLKKPTIGAETLRTLILICGLSIVGLITEHFHKYKIDPRLNDTNLAPKIAAAVEEVFNSGELFSSMGMASTTHWFFKIPLNIIYIISENSKMWALFKNIMVQFTTTLVSFGGWEFGAQLFKEATNRLYTQLESPEERELLADRNHIFTMVFRAINQQDNDPELKKQKAALKILGFIWQNMFLVLTTSEVRIAWIYNAIRHRIMSGTFFSLISSMAMGASIGTTIWPAAGTALGMSFGIVGGLTNMYVVPEEQKNSLTVFLKKQYLKLIDASMANSSSLLLGAGFQNDPQKTSLVDPDKSFNMALLERITYRRKTVDVYIEKIYYYRSLLTANTQYLNSLYNVLSSTEKPQEMRDEIEEVLSKSKTMFVDYVEALKNLISLYFTEAALSDSYKTSEKHQWVVDLLQDDVIHAEGLASHLCTMTKSLLSLDIVNDNNISDPLEVAPNLATVELLCKYKLQTPVKSYEELGDTDKASFDSAVRFLEKVNSAQFNEIELSLDRVRALNNLDSE
jgi:hypothetical protein